MLVSADVVGAPCWLSLAARERKAAERFYGAVLGWSYRPSGLGRAITVAERDGVPVAGIAEVAAQLAVPVAWTAYFAVADADAAVARVRERGGTVGVGPVPYPPRGRAALASDREGAVFGLWEGQVTAGWKVGGSGAPVWLELHTRDAFDAALFYGEVLEWLDNEAGCCEVSYEEDRVVLRQDGEAVARLDSGPVEAGSPQPQRRPRWLVHFRCTALDAAVAAALDHGGTVVEDTGSLEQRRVTLQDPDGALFTLDQAPSPPDQAPS